MHGPLILGWLLVTLTGAAGLHCLVRSCAPAREAGCARRGANRESDAAEALMGLGMAAMALPLAPGHGVTTAVWAAVFSGAGAWFIAAALRSGDLLDRVHRLHHAVGSGAMAYTAWAMTAGGVTGSQHPEHSGLSGGPPLPLLTGLLLVYFGGFALWTVNRLLQPQVAVTAVGGFSLLHAPGMPQACRLVMGLGMFAMLLTG